MDSLQNQIDELKASNEEILNSISALWTAHNGLQTEVDGIQIEIGEVQSTLEALGYTVTEQGELINTLTGQVATIEDAIEDLYEKDAQFAADIEKLTRDLQTYYSFIKEKFAKFITSIELNATFNPLFGTLNLPIGISSNILSTYIYSADHRVNFPIISTSYEFDPDSEVIRNNALYNAISKLREGASDENVQINAGTLMVPEYPDHNNMGELYVTINPKNVELDGVRVSLVNSKDEAILTHSSHIALNQEKDLDLSFTTRADGPNLYSIPVELTPNWEDVDQIALHLENKSEFVYAIKDAIKDHTISDFAHVGRMIYDYLQDFLPAYALKISWQDPGDMVSINGVEMNTYEENAVYSNYGIAATTVHPLSYSTGFGFGVDKKLPIFDPISEYFRTYSEKLKNSLKIDLGNLGGFQPITFERATIEINVDNVKISLAGTPVYNDEGEEIGHLGDDAVITLVFNGDGTLSSENEGDLEELISAIEDAIGKTYDQVDDIVAQVNNMINEINDQLSSLEGNINGQISDLIDKVNNALKGKLKYADKLVDLYNQLAARVNQFLDNPNHYLQVVMAYTSAEGGMHHLSNNQAAPTRFNVAGGNAFELFATSYNADLVVPSYKKYVAISQVFTTKGEPAAEMNNNIVAINEAAGLNKILRGDQQRVPVNVSNKNYFKPGYTYQVYYSSLDYRGYTSTQVYYFTIAE